MEIRHCRFCGGLLTRIVSLGLVPIVNYFPTASESKKEKKYPLRFCICKTCGLGQLDYMLPPSKLFRTYHYATGASKPLVSDLDDLARMLVKQFALRKGEKVLDVGCNDGTLLRAFQKKGMQVLGIDPAANITKNVSRQGVPIRTEFFTEASAQRLHEKYGTFNIITATRVLANIKALNSFFRGIKSVLATEGIFIAEVASLEDMIRTGQFDSIYHEHYSYFSLDNLERIAKKHKLKIFRADHFDSQGGSWRVFMTHAENEKIKDILQRTKPLTVSEYARFAKATKRYKELVRLFLQKLPKGKLVGLGAPAKGVTLLNYCKVTKNRLVYIADTTQYKQGRIIPGIHVPIVSEKLLHEDPEVTHVLLLAWTYKDRIVDTLERLRSKDIKIIVPFPRPHILRS
jgi:ubiquinone/menaquinone biosynthesis C-methylase UbiE